MTRSARARWTTASELLRLMHREPGITRRQAGERLALASGALTETVERLRAADLLAESRAPSSGRGRPTTILEPHERGPLMLVAELSARHWAVSLADLAGRMAVVASGGLDQDQPAAAVRQLAQAVGLAADGVSGRVRVVVAAVAGTVSGTRLVQLTARGWIDIELAPLTHRISGRRHVALLVGNDATLAGIAEASTGAARGASVALHVLITHGLGGALLVDGRPVRSAHGRGGEFGHLPFGDPTLTCPCGARGCWGDSVDGGALARLTGHRSVTDSEVYAQRILRSLTHGTDDVADARAAARVLARRLGAGIAGLVNAHDPEVITLGGLAPLIKTTDTEAFDDAYTSGLMLATRRTPPPVRNGAYGDNGPARGATVLGIDHLTAPTALAEWVGQGGRADPGPSDRP